MSKGRYNRTALARLLQAVAEPVGDAFLILDEAGALLAASREGTRLLGLLGGLSGVGRGLEELQIQLGPALPGGSGSGRRELELLGRAYEVGVKEIPLGAGKGSGEGPRGLAMVLRDASRERELARLKSEFFANTSHELRTPLNAIIGFTELSLDEDSGALSEAHRHNLSRVLANAKNLLRMINDILDLAKLESYKMDVRIQPVSVPALVDEVLESVRPLVVDKGLELRKELAPELPEMRTDPDKLKRVLLNLLSNAAKYTERGHVLLSVRVLEGEQVEFLVRDSGIGIPASAMPNIFERFHRVDGSPTRKVGGAGLGLSLVKALCQLLGGKVGVESVQGEGSAFRVQLPVEISYARRRREDQMEGEQPLGALS